ncbi:hypothetical protein MLPF_2675 [Mycobacterium lepromatosis]|nr:hypothetical protein MLPF_2675 [Mycobacterium lepromatosis]
MSLRCADPPPQPSHRGNGMSPNRCHPEDGVISNYYPQLGSSLTITSRVSS